MEVEFYGFTLRDLRGMASQLFLNNFLRKTAYGHCVIHFVLFSQNNLNDQVITIIFPSRSSAAYPSGWVQINNFNVNVSIFLEKANTLWKQQFSLYWMEC